jgi:acid phosphatase family membrane protein YuiD
MDWLSPYLLAAGLGWFVAQTLKYAITSYKTKKFESIRLFNHSGSMPSAHSSSVIALLVVIGFKDGVESAVFGLAALFAAVVMYDAINVRRSSGEQGAALVGLFADLKRKSTVPFRVAKGHTPLEVLGGIIVGVAVGIVVYFATLN